MRTRDSSSELIWGAERSDAPDSRPPDARRAVRPEPCDGRSAPAEQSDRAGLVGAEPVSVGALSSAGADAGSATDTDMSAESALQLLIRERLKAAGEWQYARGYVNHPAFRSARIAALNLLRMVPPDLSLLVMRDQALRALRELVLEQDRGLVVPNKSGDGVYRIPRSALYAKDGTRIPLMVDPLPRGSTPYVGPVGAVVVGCLAFQAAQRRLYSFDPERTAGILEKAREGLAGGFTLDPGVSIYALASDAQEIEIALPKTALSYVAADAVITPTRAIYLGTGKVSCFTAPSGADIPTLTHLGDSSLEVHNAHHD